VPALASNQSASSTQIDILFDGTEVEDADVISFVVDRDLGQPDMAVITLRNDHHKHTKGWSPAQSVEIKAGGTQEGSPKSTVFKGEIVGIEPVFKERGDSRVVIRAFNKMHRMLYGNTIGKRAAQTIRVVSGSHVAGLTLQITENKKLDLLPPPGFPFDNKLLPTFFPSAVPRRSSRRADSPSPHFR
jgi:hypothetical protein